MPHFAALPLPIITALPPDSVPCRLCAASTAPLFETARSGHYYRCQQCDLIEQAPQELPTTAAERAVYELHENDPADGRYREFLDRARAPLVLKLAKGARGLDYGCGSGPALVAMLREAGFPTAGYDPLFEPDTRVLRHRYDFITCTETAEHFHHPGREFERLHALLKPGGWLALMTEFWHDRTQFAGWWYHRDPTHVAFYTPRCLRWMADRYGWCLELPARSVALFRKAPIAAAALQQQPDRQ